MRSILKITPLIFLTPLSCQQKQPQAQELPNILWLTSEDNSPFLGCYGDTLATTPHLDKLASQGFLYTHAYANAPVSAPSRNTIITGVYANSAGNENMRSTYAKSDEVRFYPQFLRELGYYCTNNKKEDYNILGEQLSGIWDESSDQAHYRNRKPGQPFFAIFNTTLSHEHVIHESIPDSELRHDPKKMSLPPYHPRTPEMEHDWAQYYDYIERMDAWIGEQLQELEDNGLLENTIVFYYADHGGILGRSKRYIYESGTRVPLIVRIPDKYKHLFPNMEKGTKVDRLISLIDLAPTLLSITGIPKPAYMQGNAFLGHDKTEDPEYVYMFRGRMDERYDLSRAVRDKKYRYIRNYMPHRIYGQHIAYLWRAPSLASWEQAYLNGECNEVQSRFWQSKPAEELYDTENDPWEVVNLAGKPEYGEVLERMRRTNREWLLEIRDAGFIPEADRSTRVKSRAIYDYMREENIPLEEIVNAAEVASEGNPENLPLLVKFLDSDDSAIRYWGAMGLLILGEKARPAVPALEKASADNFPNVATVAAEALYSLGRKELAEQILLDKLKNDDHTCIFALNSVDVLGIDSKAVKDKVSEIAEKYKLQYNLSAAEWLLKKWGI